MSLKALFPGQQENEQICLVIREHWISLFLKLVIWFLFAAVYLVIDYLDVVYLPSNIDSAFLPLVEVVKIAFLMFLALGLFIIFTLYYLNVYIITSERIVNIQQLGLLRHTISELHLEQIQDVTAEIHGLPENVFDYGDVFIQTAGETERFVFQNIPGPTKVTKLILDLYEQLPDDKKHPHV
jgi:ABC-type multidrug transport system fused ATPase/permease subunit